MFCFVFNANTINAEFHNQFKYIYFCHFYLCISQSFLIFNDKTPRLKTAEMDRTYFARKEFLGSLVYNNNNFGCIWRAVFTLEYLFFVRGGRIPLLSLNELRMKFWTAINSGNFVKEPKFNCYGLFKHGYGTFKAHLWDIYSFDEL